MTSSKKLFIFIGIGLVVIVGVSLLALSDNQPGKLDAFAQCLGEQGAKFYGAFWCPHCQNQKAMFGKSEKLLPYVECSTPDGRSQLPICNDIGISSYPTWIFTDGSKLTGEIPLADLAVKTSCELSK